MWRIPFPFLLGLAATFALTVAIGRLLLHGRHGNIMDAKKASSSAAAVDAVAEAHPSARTRLGQLPVSTNLSTQLPTISTNLSTQLPTISTNLSTQLPTISTNLSTQLPTISTNLSTQLPTISTNLSDQLQAKCSGKLPCISFGTPYFSHWNGWMQYVRDGLDANCDFACEIVSESDAGDAVIFHGWDLNITLHKQLPTRRYSQSWVYLNMESPLSTAYRDHDVAFKPQQFRYLFNWSATTMLDSTVHLPYGAWKTRPDPVSGPFYDPKKKRHLAYIAFSNCNYSYNNRTEKVALLRRHMEVHIYGECGDRKLPRDWNVWRSISEQYRFYLSFENALCRDYITEKFHNNGLNSQAVPVAFGGLSRADYERVSPPNSFVYALDFATMKQLADYLKALAADEDRYAGYFKWKSHYQESIGGVLCGTCARLHQDRSEQVYDLSNFYDTTKNCRPNDYAYLI